MHMHGKISLHTHTTYAYRGVQMIKTACLYASLYIEAFYHSTHSRYTARALIQSSQWCIGLRQILPNGDPIINEIIQKMPGTPIRLYRNVTPIL